MAWRALFLTGWRPALDMETLRSLSRGKQHSLSPKVDGQTPTSFNRLIMYVALINDFSNHL